jgi:hypothetical protein
MQVGFWFCVAVTLGYVVWFGLLVSMWL